MLVTQEDFLEYLHFADGVAVKLGFKNELPEIIWHYTSASGLLGILETGSLYATQLACLNDQSELRYAVFQVRSALQMLRSKPGDDPDKDYVFELLDEAAAVDVAPNSELYVTCFSKAADDLSQWRAYGGGENGYAIAFNTMGLYSQHSVIAPVCYDTRLHREVAGEVAAGYLEFFLRGLRRGLDRQRWTQDFATSWETRLARLAPWLSIARFVAKKSIAASTSSRPRTVGCCSFDRKQVC